jgi:SAM-dependent methyltransferase
VIDFNDAKTSYKDSIEESIRFVGKDLDFFVSVKADYLARIVKQHVRGPVRPRVLDVGCGHGLIHPRLTSAGLDVVGVDVATEVLEMAREANPGVSYLGYDGTTLPFDAASFDVAVAICVMHHVPPAQWGAFLAEMRRVVKPGGLVIVFEHNPYNPMTRYVVAHSELDRGVQLLSSPQLKRLMGAVGLAPQSRFILFTPLAHPLFRWLDGKLGWCPLGAQYYVAATHARTGLT